MTEKLTMDGLAALARRSREEREGFRARITVHMGTCGLSAGAQAVFDAFAYEAKNHADIHVSASGCAGMCSREPMVTVEVKGFPRVIYCDITPDKVRKVFASHGMENRPVVEYALAQGLESVH